MKDGVNARGILYTLLNRQDSITNTINMAWILIRIRSLLAKFIWLPMRVMSFVIERQQSTSSNSYKSQSKFKRQYTNVQ